MSNDKNPRYQPKQVILIRTDIEMPAGKVAAQAAHAALKCLFDAGNFDATTFSLNYRPELKVWFEESFAKVCLGVASTTEMQEILAKAKEKGLWTAEILDEGRTVFKEPTITCGAIGPATYEEINPITGHLKLYRGSIKPPETSKTEP